MKKTFILENLDCVNCANKIENAIKKIEGVEYASVSFMTQCLIIEANENYIDAIIKKINKVIKHIDPQCRIVF